MAVSCGTSIRALVREKNNLLLIGYEYCSQAMAKKHISYNYTPLTHVDLSSPTHTNYGLVNFWGRGRDWGNFTLPLYILGMYTCMLAVQETNED